MQGTLKVISADYSTFQPVDYITDTQLNITGGGSVIKTFRMSNTGSDFPMSALVTFTLTDNTLTQGNCKIWLRDAAGTSLATDDTVSGNTLTTSATYSAINQLTNRDGKFEVQCNPDINNTFDYTLTMEPQATFNFKSS
jgi:hypothetical protein